MPKFRKKPVLVEARQLTSETASDIYTWVEANTQGSFNVEDDARPANGVSIDPSTGRMIIATVEGDAYASLGDWIIRDDQGEFSRCKQDVFDATYEPAVDELDSDDAALADESEGDLFLSAEIRLEFKDGRDWRRGLFGVFYRGGIARGVSDMLRSVAGELQDDLETRGVDDER